MKILHMIGGGDVGGAKTHVLSLVSELSKSNDVVLVSFREGEFALDARALGIDTRIIKSKNPLRDIGELKRLIIDGGFDIVHCHGAKANVMASMIKPSLKIPVITTVHSDYRLDYMGNIIKRLTNGLMNTVALRTLDGYIGVTNAFLDLLCERGFDPYKLYTLNNGIDFSNSPTPRTDREEYLRHLGIDDSESTIVCGIAARFHPVKDIATAIRAMAKVRKEFPNLYLVLGGDGEQAEFLRDLVKRENLSDRVIFAGWIEDMDSFLNSVDISIISSVSEGFPYSILESIHAKCTMISTKVGAMPEIIDDGENGLLFDVGDVRKLAEHISFLAKNPEIRKGMAEKLLLKAKEKYSFDAMVKTQVSIYEKAVSAYKNRLKKRDQVLICGSYGRGNAGDDAILKAVIREVYEASETAKICVMSKNPKQTKRSLRVRSIYTFNVFKMLCAMRKSHLYINGGGSLIQDSTSSRSLYFYLMTLLAAKLSKCDVMMYGCGIGPVTRGNNRRISAKIIDKAADCITLRDPDSFSELQSMGVKAPKMVLAADPTLGIAKASESKINAIFGESGLSPDGKYICLALRSWKNIDEKIGEIARLADYAKRKYDLEVILLPMERKKDIVIAEKCAEQMKECAHIIKSEMDVSTVIGVLSRMRVICAMRLHALVFGAGQGVATIGIAYDHKVTGFMNYIGREMCVQYDDCSFEILKSYIDRTMNDTEYSENMQTACRVMRENERENVKKLREFFDKR